MASCCTNAVTGMQLNSMRPRLHSFLSIPLHQAQGPHDVGDMLVECWIAPGVMLIVCSMSVRELQYVVYNG